METQMGKIYILRDLMLSNGIQLAVALLTLIIGLVLVKYFVRWVQTMMLKTKAKPHVVSMVTISVNVLLVMVIVVVASVELGLNPKPIVRLLTILTLAVIGIIILFRPLLPTLPFKVGNTVKIGDLLGKIEATTIINTRVRTFDGRTIFVPNQKILNDIVINYHYTPFRRISIDVGIRYDQDLMKAKQLLEIIMIEDPRVLPKPAPAVWVLNLSPNAVELGARCWTLNAPYWMTKVELMEKIKLRFDAEGIFIAHTQVDVHHFTQGAPWALKSQEWGKNSGEDESFIPCENEHPEQEA
jgi:small conductance mechanosensitive channel